MAKYGLNNLLGMPQSLSFTLNKYSLSSFLGILTDVSKNVFVMLIAM